MNSRCISVRFQAGLACFTRPESKVERVSYPVLTPSAARGALEAIYWHPQFRWVVREIRVLAEIKTFSILRNEVNSKMSPSSPGFFADEDRTQRHAVCLRDVDYVVLAEPVPKLGTDPAAKHIDILNRRVAKGQCFHRPYLGTREFAAEFSAGEGSPTPIDVTEDFGLMLWDLAFPERDKDNKFIDGKPAKAYPPLFFSAKLDRGLMRIPDAPIGGDF